MKAKLTERLIQSLTPSDEGPYEAVDQNLPGFLVRIQPSGVMTYVYAYRTHAGKKRRITIGRCESVALVQARELAKRYAGEVASGRDPQEQKQQAREQVKKERVQTLGCFIELVYAPWAHASHKASKRTLRILSRYFNHWYRLPMDRLSHSMGAEWQIQELERGVKPSTVNRNLNSLRGVLTLAIERGVLELHPFSRLKNIKECDEQSTRYLSSEELARLFNTLDARQTRMIEERRSANLWRRQRRRAELPDIPEAAFADHLYPLIVVALNTGMRKGELFALKWTNIDMEAGYITVQASVAKSKRVRHIPMNASVMTALDRWRNSPCGSQSGLVFPGKSGKPLRDVKKAWGALLQAAAIFEFRFHDMRHHFASQLTIKGAHPSVVQKLLGHADIETTMRYAHLGPNQMTDAVNLLVD